MPANNQATRLDVTFQVTDGKVCPPIAELPLANGFYEAEFDKARYGISTKQIRYYRGVILPPLADYFGYTVKEMHEVIKAEFLTETLIPKFDKRRRHKIVKSTTDLTTMQAEDLFVLCRALGAKF